MSFRLIPANPDGFLMGSRGSYAREEPIHRVVISDDFWLGETPVTQAQFAVWTQSEGIAHKNRFGGSSGSSGGEYDLASGHGFLQLADEKICARRACRRSSRQLQVCQFPTEAQWEYACRAGTRTDYYTGDGDAALRAAGWFDGNSSGSTQPVGKLAPNDFGLYDMHGNVWEWCLDRWDDSAYRRRWEGITDNETFLLNEKHGEQHEVGEIRVLRGGSWITSAVRCRAAARDWSGAGVSFGIVGFRVCLVRSPTIVSSSPAEP